ncbi:hypothetical protein F5Y10DRAFT_255630 [Nemania abortiva]|nr:hypothetical protein F5Y10DRAFT_255630 [Nemania abortiva]
MAEGFDFYALTPEEQEQFLDSSPASPPSPDLLNMANPPNRNLLVFSVVSAGLFLSTLVFAIRAIARHCRMKQCKIADVVAALAFIFYVIHTWTLYSFGLKLGWFAHLYNFRFRDLRTLNECFALNRTFYSFSIWSVKNAILLDRIRLFVPINKNTFYWLCVTLIVTNSGLYVSTIFTTHFGCTPREKAWEPWRPGSCINTQTADTFAVSFNLFTDLLMLFLPQGVIWKLHARRDWKIGISLIFSLGVLTCLCASGRVYVLATSDYDKGDSIQIGSNVIIWAFGELTAAFLVLCIPWAPKAFAGVPMFCLSAIRQYYSSAVARIRTKSKSSASASTGAGNKLWPTSNSSKTYRRMGDGDVESVVPLHDMACSGGDKLHTTASLPGHGIMATTEISIAASEPRINGEQDYYRQQLWT